jgi:anionic cell wall polymer biosynthesis LytR-Cps2A-Psr (LCP) family protein
MTTQNGWSSLTIRNTRSQLFQCNQKNIKTTTHFNEHWRTNNIGYCMGLRNIQLIMFTVSVYLFSVYLEQYTRSQPVELSQDDAWETSTTLLLENSAASSLVSDSFVCFFEHTKHFKTKLQSQSVSMTMTIIA